jgi:hypothetical protein
MNFEYTWFDATRYGEADENPDLDYPMYTNAELKLLYLADNSFEISPKETEIMLSWEEAVIYCKFLEVDGRKDWRLPTCHELNVIFHKDNDCEDSRYWSATAHKRSNIHALYYMKGMGSSIGYTKTRYHVRAVRTI